jgi:hypothetical protein
MRIIYGPSKNHDVVSIEGGAWRSEGTKAKSFNTMHSTRYGARIFPRRPHYKRSVEAAQRHNSIAFAPQGSRLDCCHV